MNITALQTFLAIVDTGSLVRASQVLHVTQSTVTARLKSLEDEIGQQLLDRQKSGTTLTPAGTRSGWVLDEEGLAPSRNLNLSANKHIYRVLDLENAIIRRGAGLSGNPDRGTGAAALSPTQEEEDLRRHLDRFPYLDLRHAVEMPDTWTSSF